MPALVVLGLWIVLQLFSGIGSIATTSSTTETGGVAYAAHVGGFITGILLTLLFRGRKPKRQLSVARRSSGCLALKVFNAEG